MAGNQGVGIRIFVDGAEAVRRTFKQVGDDGQDMLVRLASGAGTVAGTAVGGGLRAVSAVVGEVGAGVDDLAQRAGPAGRVLGALGPVGIATAAALGGLVVALDQTRKAMQFFDDLQATADRIGITAESLQELRFAAGEVSVDADKLEGSLEGLNGALGKIQTGAKAPSVRAAFDTLGITDTQLASMDNAADLLPLLAERISKLGSTAEQVQVAKALGVEDLLPLLRKGADGVAELTDEARALGLVASNEVSEGLAAANRELEVAGERIDSQLRMAFAGLSDELVAVVGGLADLLQMLNRVIEASSGFSERFSPSRLGLLARRRLTGLDKRSTLGSVDVPTASEIAEMLDLPGPQARSRAGAVPVDPADARAADKAARAAEAAARKAAQEAARRQREAEAAARKAAQEARQREQRAARAQGEMYRADDRLSGAAYALTAYDPNSVASAEFEEIKRNARRLAQQLAKQVAVYEKTNGQEGLTQEEADAISYANLSADEAQRTLAERQRVRGVLEQTLRNEREQMEAVAAMLGFQLENANTQAERREIALQQLAVEREQLRRERQRLDELDLTLTPAQRAARLGNFDAETARMSAGIRRGTMGPGEAFADELNRAAASGNEAFEAVYVDGLRSLEDGIMDVISGARDLQSTFADVARSIVADLTRIAIQRQIIGPLANMLFGPEKGAGGADGGRGLLATAGSVILKALPKFDVGGYTGPSMGLVHPYEYVVNPAATALNRDLLDAMNAGWSPRMAGGSPKIEQRVEQHFHLAGAVSPRDVVGMIRRGQQETMAATTQVVDMAAPGRQRQRYMLEE